VDDSSSSLWWILLIILPIVAIIVFFVIKNKTKKSTVATTNGESQTTQKATMEEDSAISNVSEIDSVSENTIGQLNNPDQKEIEEIKTSEETSSNQNDNNNKGNEKITILSEFVKNLTTIGPIVEPNKEIRNLIVECRDALLNEGRNKCRIELAEVIKSSSYNSTYQLTSDFTSTSDFLTYLENLVAIVKSQESEKQEKLKNQLEAKNNETKKLSEQKKTAEDSLANEMGIKVLMQTEISELTAQVSSLSAQVQELNNAEPEKVSFASLEHADQVEIKEQIKQQISENFQLTIDAKQTELNIAQESIKNLNAMIGDLRNQLSSEKYERTKDMDAHSGELIQIGEKHLQEINELNARHQEALEYQKSIHETEKVEWEHQEKEYKAKIKKGEETLKEKLLAAEEAQKLAVQDAIAETEATAKQILDEEIKAREEEREQNESRIQKIKEDNVKEKEAIQKKMQRLLDQAINDCDEAVNGRKDERQMLAYEMQQHIARMYQQLTIAFNSSVGNFKTEGVELIKEAESMYNWYQSAVVTPFQTEESLTQSEIVEIVQLQSIKQIQDKYSLVSRLSRIVAYSQISTMWIEWMSKQGVNALALRMAYNEMCALLGRCKITLVVPSLYSDTYSKNDIYTLNMSFAPIVNFCPGEFDHLMNSQSTIVRDLSHPGYAIDGQIKAGPEVLAQ
jgi:hypothetical protein